MARLALLVPAIAEMGRVLAAKQLPMGFEALALTELTQQADVSDLEQGNFMENWVKNYITLNLLWVAPRPGGRPGGSRPGSRPGSSTGLKKNVP